MEVLSPLTAKQGSLLLTGSSGLANTWDVSRSKQAHFLFSLASPSTRVHLHGNYRGKDHAMSHLSLQSHVACGGCSAVILPGVNLPWVCQSAISRAWVEGTPSSEAGLQPCGSHCLQRGGSEKVSHRPGRAGVANKGWSALAGAITNCHPTVSITRRLCAHQEAGGERKSKIWVPRDSSRTK